MALLIEVITFALVVPIFVGVRRLARSRGYLSPILPGLGVVGYVAGSFAGPLAYSLLVDSGAEQFFTDPIEGRMFSLSLYIVSFVSGLAGAGTVALATALLPSRTTRPTPGVTKVILYRVLGGILGVAGLVTLFLTTAYRLGFFGSLAGFGLISVGGYCLTLAKKAGGRLAEDAVVSDPRPPVLFLRSFSQDEEYTVSQPFGLRGWLFFLPSNWGARSFISFEEFISAAIQRDVGPMVALGNPSEYLPSIGAAKSYQDSLTWQAAIAQFVMQARCICVLEGISPGVAWELEYLRHHAEPIKILFLTHPENTGRLRVRATEFWRTVRDAGYGVPGSGLPGLGTIIAFDHAWRALSVVIGAKTPEEYAGAIRNHLEALHR